MFSVASLICVIFNLQFVIAKSAASVDRKLCHAGIIDYRAKVCCPSWCNRCGGYGCAARGRSCCSRYIHRTRRVCGIEQPPCRILHAEADGSLNVGKPPHANKHDLSSRDDGSHKTFKNKFANLTLVTCASIADKKFDDVTAHFGFHVVRENACPGGREAACYLSFIIRNYDSLTENAVVVFAHGHERAWHQPPLNKVFTWSSFAKTDYGNFNIKAKILQIRSETKQGLIWSNELSQVLGAPPKSISTMCCSQFWVRWRRVKSVDLDVWERLRERECSVQNCTNPALRPPNFNCASYELEHTWHMLLGEPKDNLCEIPTFYRSPAKSAPLPLCVYTPNRTGNLQ
eukprot:1177494-Prorocentrum_minimum.AAC.4